MLAPAPSRDPSGVAVPPDRRMHRAPNTGTSRARRSRPFRPRRRGPCRRSSRRCPSAAGRARRLRGSCRAPARNGRTNWLAAWPKSSAERTRHARRPEEPALRGTDHLVKNSDVAGDLDIMGDDISQPTAVIGDARADAASRFRQPPMLNVAFDELPRGGAQRCAHARFRAATRTAPSRPAIDRENHRRRSPDRSRRAPTPGRPGSGREANDSGEYPARGPAS